MVKSSRKMATIDIIPGSEIPQDQVAAIKEIFISEGLSAEVSSAVYIRKAEGLPPIVVFGLGAFVGGFIGGAGRDAWDAFKRAIRKTFHLLKKERGQNPQIQCRLEEKDTRIIANFPTETEDLIEEALSKLPTYLDKRPKGSTWMWFDDDSHEWKAT